MFERVAEFAPTGAFFAEERVPWFDHRSGPIEGLSALAQVAVKRESKRRD
ncbi:hypothetical protein U91I_00559 [alpha proteobacterium U9-1i]|nr:hypothetical protein U91I_00559 [alpha proteobacterium U9-1i]